MSADRKKRKVAVVLSGGGAKGAYEVGALKALRKHKVEPEIYCGTSVGSFNCAMAVSGRTLEEMEDVWVSLTHSRVFKLRFDFRQLLTHDPKGITSFLDFNPQNAKALIQQGEKQAEETLSRHYEKEMVGPSGKKKMALFSQ